MNTSFIPRTTGSNKTLRRRVLAASQTALLVTAMCVGSGWVQPQQAHACTCGPSTNGSGGTNGVNSSANDPKNPPMSPPGDTPTAGTPSSGPTGGTSTGGTPSGGLPDDTVDYGGYAGGGGGGGVPGLHVTSAPRLPASAGVWSSGGWALGGMLRGTEVPSRGPWLEAPPCPGSNPPCMVYSAQQTISTRKGTTTPDNKPDDNPDDNGSTAVSTSGTGGTGGTGGTNYGGSGGGGGTAVTIPTVGPDVTVPAAGPVEVPRPPVEPIDVSAPSTRHLAVVLMSNVGTGFSAVIIILILLTIGIWYFGHRVAVQLAREEKRNA
jgi:hypothetical protein